MKANENIGKATDNDNEYDDLSEQSSMKNDGSSEILKLYLQNLGRSTRKRRHHGISQRLTSSFHWSLS